MFSGIVRSMGEVVAVTPTGGGRRLTLAIEEGFAKNVTVGASVAVAGVCLTVVERDDKSFAADVSAETLSCTTLGELTVSERVNLEPALLAAQAIDGHFVSGHVDCTGAIKALEARGESARLAVEAPAHVMPYIAVKGSVCLDGVSLTVNRADDRLFEVNLIPHTFAVTTFSFRKVGDCVNIEADLIVRYLKKLMSEKGL